MLWSNRSRIYKLWHENKLDYWCIHGTMKTNINAIEAFLERFRNTDTPVLE